MCVRYELQLVLVQRAKGVNGKGQALKHRLQLRRHVLLIDWVHRCSSCLKLAQRLTTAG
jgi:hypothetical protein